MRTRIIIFQPIAALLKNFLLPTKRLLRPAITKTYEVIKEYDEIIKKNP
jgi:hypothetical protein